MREAALSKLTRRHFVVITGGAAALPAAAQAALHPEPKLAVPTEAATQLAEARRLVAAVVEIDKGISAAEKAGDLDLVEELERKHDSAYWAMRDFQLEIDQREPRGDQQLWRAAKP